MKLNLKRTVATLAGVAALATIVPVLAAPAALAAPTNSGTAALSPTSGDSSTSYTVTPPAGAACPGDGGDGWRVTSYLVPVDVDPATLTFDTNGPVPQKYGTPYSDFRMPLLDTFGTAYVTAQPANKDATATDPNAGTIINVPQFTFAHYGAQGTGSEIPPGAYNIGIACVLASGATFPIDKFWNNTVTVTASATDTGPAGISWVQGTVDQAPVLSSLAPGDGTLTAVFDHTASDSTNTTYTATATPTAGGAAVTKTGAVSPIAIDGLANGTEYSVTVRATNLAGDSAESNAILGTPVADPQPPVQNLTATPDATPDSGIVNLDWDAPVASESTPTGYDVVVSPTGGTVTQPNPADVGDDTGAQITGLTSGTQYTFTVTPVHPAPFVGTPASVEATPVASGVTVLEQNVTVTRPAGSLVFTQRCETDANGTPTTTTTFGADACAIVFGVAERVIPAAGGTPYFAANASLNNVQVDSNGDDTGWTVTGDMSEFLAGSDANQRFSGDQLGWTPAEVSATSGLVVDLGTAITPGTTSGMSANPTLASSAPGSSLGIAELDAALDLVIPITKRAGVYSGTLTMTATPSA